MQDNPLLLHQDTFPAGGLENWRDGKGWESWRFDIVRALTPAGRGDQSCAVDSAGMTIDE